MHHVGVEPTSSFEHQGLSLTCLPISPMTQILKYTSKMYFTLATQDTGFEPVTAGLTVRCSTS